MSQKLERLACSYLSGEAGDYVWDADWVCFRLQGWSILTIAFSSKSRNPQKDGRWNSSSDTNLIVHIVQIWMHRICLKWWRCVEIGQENRTDKTRRRICQDAGSIPWCMTDLPWQEALSPKNVLGWAGRMSDPESSGANPCSANPNWIARREMKSC